MKLDILSGKVQCKCSVCGRMYSLTSGEFIRSSMRKRTTCPKCQKKGGKK